MSLIEGVGDEVTNFFVVLSVLVIGWLAWCSTSITDQPLIRTVLILQDRTRTRIAELRANHQNNNAPRAPNIESSEEERTETVSTDVSEDTFSSCPESSVTNDASGVLRENNGTTEAAASEEVLIEAMDSLNNDGGTFLERSTKISSSRQNTVSDSTNSINSENIHESSGNTTEQNINQENANSENSHITENSSSNTTAEISIKLKFINDDQKVVTGSLKELLGDFKRRHFQMELESQKLVRLIFNGQVLQPDNQTLERCGLYNNCVVHCLVHQARPTPVQSSQSSTLDNSSSIYFNPQSFQDIPAGAGISSVHNEWDLSRFLVSILTLILGLAWYSRYHYAQLFTATTTLALYALTAIFTVSLFSNFFPDQDGIRNIE